MFSGSRLVRVVIAFAVPALFAVTGPLAQPPEFAKVGEHGILHKGVKTVEAKVVPSQPELLKKAIAERLDKSGLLYTGKVVVDNDPRHAQTHREHRLLCG